jgi:phage baseplate assembly protein W
MSILVKAEAVPISFAPATITDEIAQNVRTILTTLQGTVPLNRSFGIDPTLADEPIPVTKARLTSAIIEAITLYETRATVERVEFEEDHSAGKLVPIVYLEVSG